VAGLRRSAVFQPLAVLMTILMLPVFSWFEDGGQGTRPFQAAAQQLGCVGGPGAIIKQYCVNGISYSDDLSQLERDAANAYLGLHLLPPTDAHIIYDSGRSDLRSAVRAQMITTLLEIVKTPASSRTPHEQTLYNWFSSLVQANEIALYQNAVNEFSRWQADKCEFTLDPVIAATYGLSYDGAPFCWGSISSLFAGPPVPAVSYFTAYGMRKSYGMAADTYPYFATIAATTAVNVEVVAGIAGAASALVLGSSAAALTQSLLADLQAFLEVTDAFGGGGEDEFSAFLVGDAGADVLGAATYAGPAAIIVIAIIVGVTALMQAYDDQKALNDLNNLKNILAQVTNNPPDLVSFKNDPSGVGMYKLQTTLETQTLPEDARTSALPVHSAATDQNFAIQSGGATQVSSTLGYKDWAGNKWSAQTSGGWFVEGCTPAPGLSCTQPDSISADLSYVDWGGVKWTASRMGNRFTSTKAKPAATDVKCEEDSNTLVSPGTDFSNCKSYVSDSIPLTDLNGNLVRVSLTQLIPPNFTSSNYLGFAPGYPSTQTIAVAADPGATCSLVGSLPTADFTLKGDCSNAPLQLVFNGNVNAPLQTYQVAFKATSSIGSATKIFTVNVTAQLGIISPNTVQARYGVPVNFLVVATGVPPISLSRDPELGLVAGLTFKDNGNGTATISGIPTAAGLSACANPGTDGGPTLPCGIIAQNSQGTYEQSFSMSVDIAPQATVLPPTSATFVAGVPNQFLLTSAGAVTPVTWEYTPLQDAPWLTLTDNGNGTAIFKGTPPLETTGTFSPGVVADALGSGLFNLPQTVTVNVVNIPVFTSLNNSNFTVGTFGSFAISANQGTISSVTTVPNGLSFVSGNPAGISGIPAAGSGGQYTIQLTDNADTAGIATQSLTLDVFEAPRITSPNTATLFLGMPSSFAVTTTGYPNLSLRPVGSTPVPPVSPTQGNGMYFTVSGLPADLHFSNLNPQGFATGTLTIEGTPAAYDLGVHQVTIAAQNGVGVTAQQTLTMEIVKITGPAPASGTTCNGTYNGAFQGNLTVSAGQSCAFVAGGGVNGNVSVNGGTLALDDANVTGNVTIQGSAAFSIATGTTISGNLAVQNVASGSAAGQVCGAKVGGNVFVSANATPVVIGSNDFSCQGNSFSNNVTVQDNTASVKIYNNVVQKNLACTNNTSIVGAGNLSQKKTGQCAAF
jgi:hypothetical protein